MTPDSRSSHVRSGRCIIDASIADLEVRLNDFRPSTRKSAVRELVDRLARDRVQTLPLSGRVNLHSHTFFSYNAYGHSPASLAWLAKKNGFAAMGIVDFDVLDGVDEFLGACEVLEVRASAGIETRVFVPEFANCEINSPGEPGVSYHMGIGFASGQVPAEVAPTLRSMRERASRRNRRMIQRINAHLAPLSIGYDKDVLPLTPAGNATERHILQAYLAAAVRLHPSRARRCAFWAAKLDISTDEVDRTIDDNARFSGLVRGKLMKRGGIGYVKPTPESFPTVEEFHRLIVACGALPCATWLDGTSEGEQTIGKLLETLIAKGVVALNIIPDRNWNLPEGQQRAKKIANLHEIGRMAADLDLPLNVGTEMNSPGNPLIDDFAAVPMAPLTGAFMAGAYFIYGHTILQRYCGLGYQSDWAQTQLQTRRERYTFYESVGRRVAPGPGALVKCNLLSDIMSPKEMLAALETD